MDQSQLRNIAFLLSLGGLSLGCPGDEKGESDSGTGNTNSNSNSNSDGTTSGTPTTSGAPTTSSASEGSGTATEGGTTGGDSTGSPVTSGTTGSDTTGTSTETDPSAGFVSTRGSTGEEGTTGEPLPEVQSCTDFGDKFAMCFPRYRMYASQYTMYCQMIFFTGSGDGADCTAALEEFFACVNGLECMAFGAELMTPAMCKEQFDASNAACPSLMP